MWYRYTYMRRLLSYRIWNMSGSDKARNWVSVDFCPQETSVDEARFFFFYSEFQNCQTFWFISQIPNIGRRIIIAKKWKNRYNFRKNSAKYGRNVTIFRQISQNSEKVSHKYEKFCAISTVFLWNSSIFCGVLPIFEVIRSKIVTNFPIFVMETFYPKLLIRICNRRRELMINFEELLVDFDENWVEIKGSRESSTGR